MGQGIKGDIDDMGALWKWEALLILVGQGHAPYRADIDGRVVYPRKTRYEGRPHVRVGRALSARIFVLREE